MLGYTTSEFTGNRRNNAKLVLAEGTVHFMLISLRPDTEICPVRNGLKKKLVVDELGYYKLDSIIGSE